MDIQNLLSELKRERERIQQAISALEGLDSGARGGSRGPRRGKRVMSADARARISKAMKLRWAQRKKKVA